MWRPLKEIKKSSNGFLIFQVGIVLALMVLIITLSLSQTSVLRRHIVHAHAQKMSILFRYLQQKACATQKEQKLVFDERTRRYYTDVAEYHVPQGVLFGFSPNAYGPPSSPKQIISKAITFKNNTVHFSPDGSMTPGTIYMADAEKKITYALTVPISSISLLRLYRLESSWICLT